MATRAERKSVRRKRACSEIGCPNSDNDGVINSYFRAALAQKKPRK